MSKRTGTKTRANKKTKGKYKPPVKIPLDFDTAMGGLMQVKPEDVKRPEKKKAAKKR